MIRYIVGAMLALALAGGALAQQQNQSVTLLSSAARTAASVSTGDQTNTYWKSTHVIINVSAYTSGNYTPKLQAKDPVSGSYYDLLTGTAISGTGMTILKVGPGFAAVANGSAADILPKVWRLTFTGASTPSMTFSVGAYLAD